RPPRASTLISLLCCLLSGLPPRSTLFPYTTLFRSDGGQRAALAERLSAAWARNVTLLPPMSRDALLDEYRRADDLLLHLNGFPSLENVLPSKVFEYAATGKPILAGVEGYALRSGGNEIVAGAVFDPGDARAMAEALGSLEPLHFERTRFKEAYRRDRLMDAMAADILAAAAAEPREVGRAAPVGR